MIFLSGHLRPFRFVVFFAFHFQLCHYAYYVSQAPGARQRPRHSSDPRAFHSPLPFYHIFIFLNISSFICWYKRRRVSASRLANPVGELPSETLASTQNIIWCLIILRRIWRRLSFIKSHCFCFLCAMCNAETKTHIFDSKCYCSPIHESSPNLTPFS